MISRQIFVNLPVKDLNKSIAFFERLGFAFNPQFTNENATCMIVGENIYAMLLVENFFAGFTPKPIADAKQSTEVLIALSAESRNEVDAMIENAISGGGREPREPQDHGWMYGRSFEDLDGHIWEVAFMDESAISQEGA